MEGGADMLRPDRVCGYRGNQVSVMRAEEGEERYGCPGCQRLRSGDIVVRKTKAAAIECHPGIEALHGAVEAIGRERKEKTIRGLERRCLLGGRRA